MANLVTLLRMLLCFVVTWLLLARSHEHYWWAFVLTVLIIWMDGLDGYLARKFNETSRFGAMFDILGDRVVEQIYWLLFLALHWVPLWMVMAVIVRGVLVDGFRAIATEQGYTAFGSTSMMQSPLGILLVSSRFSRWTYAACKAVAFSLVILVHMPGPGLAGIRDPWQHQLEWPVTIALYATVAFCLIRGLPVLIESQRFFKPEKSVN